MIHQDTENAAKATTYSQDTGNAAKATWYSQDDIVLRSINGIYHEQEET